MRVILLRRQNSIRQCLALLIFLVLQSLAQAEMLWLNNGVLKVGLDKNAGGAITYISTSGSNYNVVNIADRGRMIQQSYYAGPSLNRQSQGQSPHWSPWAWNPIQVGDCAGHSSALLQGFVTGNSAYTMTKPLLWDMTTGEQAEAFMEQWTELDGTVVHVACRITCQRNPTDQWNAAPALHQECPAFYTIGELGFLYSYTGSAPFTNGKLTHVVNNPNDGFIWDEFTATEHWAANVNRNHWGLGIYTPKLTKYLGGFTGGKCGIGGPKDGATAYIAPIDIVSLGRNSIYEYSYTLILGNLSDIRKYVYQKQSNGGSDVNGGVIPQPGVWYKIIARHSGKVLDVDHASLDNGGNVMQHDWNGGHNQQWMLESLGTGFYKIIARHSGKVLDVDLASQSNGGNVMQHDWNGGHNQQWMLESLGAGFYKIIARHSGKVLDVDHAFQNNGGNVMQQDWNGGHNQHWAFMIP